MNPDGHEALIGRPDGWGPVDISRGFVQTTPSAAMISEPSLAQRHTPQIRLHGHAAMHNKCLYRRQVTMHHQRMPKENLEDHYFGDQQHSSLVVCCNDGDGMKLIMLEQRLHGATCVT